MPTGFYCQKLWGTFLSALESWNPGPGPELLSSRGLPSSPGGLEGDRLQGRERTLLLQSILDPNHPHPHLSGF